MKKILLLFSLLASAALSGCASTTMTIHDEPTIADSTITFALPTSTPIKK
jgi:uncharacterized protein YceK